MKSRDVIDQSISFFIFHNVSLAKESENCDDDDLLSHVLFQYKNILSDEELKKYLTVIISLFTFTKISLGDKEIRLLSFDSFKIAINTFLMNDDSSIFFVLKISSDFPDEIIQNTLNRINNVIFFFLGNTFKNDIKFLQNYLSKEGNRIIDISLNASKLSLLKCNISFPSQSKNNCDNCAIIISTLMTSIQKLSVKIWGSSCFIENKLLISQIPISISTFFQYIPLNDGNFPVFLNDFQREQIIQSPNFCSSIPNLDVIESVVLVFTDSLKKVAFYILVDCSFIKEELLIKKIKEMIDSSYPFIYENSEDTTTEENVANTISYDSYLLDVKIGESSETFEENVLKARNSFLNDNRLNEIVMKNPKDLTICYRIISMEHYSFVEDNGKDGFLDLYQKCINLNPSLKRYIEGFSSNKC